MENKSTCHMTNEKRLIDANALAFEPDQWGGMNGVICVGRSGGKTMATVQAALKCMINNAPTVDAVEVVYGHWRKYSDDKFMGYSADGRIQYKKVYTYECSKCGRNTAVKSNYCPNCGASMRDGDGNG